MYRKIVLRVLETKKAAGRPDSVEACLNYTDKINVNVHWTNNVDAIRTKKIVLEW